MAEKEEEIPQSLPPERPRRVFLTRGFGRHAEKFASYEMALRDARLQPYNIVHVSSIVPPGCRVVSRNEGLPLLAPGQIVHAVMAENATDEANRLIAASIGVAIPGDPEQHGYLSEHHSFGERDELAGAYSEDLAAKMLATSLGIPIEVDASYDQQKRQWKLQGKIIRTSNSTQSALGKASLWTTVLAVAVFTDE